MISHQDQDEEPGLSQDPVSQNAPMMEEKSHNYKGSSRKKKKKIIQVFKLQIWVELMIFSDVVGDVFGGPGFCNLATIKKIMHPLAVGPKEHCTSVLATAILL